LFELLLSSATVAEIWKTPLLPSGIAVVQFVVIVVNAPAAKELIVSVAIFESSSLIVTSISD